MQTFMPYPSFEQSVRCLDMKRLGKQRVEAYQILDTLLSDSRWRSHPAVKMWHGFERSLITYYNVCVTEWVARGYNNTMPLLDDKGTTIDTKYGTFYCDDEYCLPHWMGNLEFHRSHQSNLLRKLPTYYSQFNWAVSSELPYVWPKGKSNE